MHALSSPAQYLTALQNISPLNIGGLIWLIVLNTMLAYTLYVWMLSRMTVVEFTCAGISNPMAGILMGLLLVGEKFSSTQYLLMGLIILTSLSGSLLSTYFAKKQANKQTNKTIINNEIKPTATKSI